jgi:hypothetical protein
MCPVCKLIFADEFAFDAHRVGKHSISSTRICVPLEALRSKGLKLVDPILKPGVWCL